MKRNLPWTAPVHAVPLPNVGEGIAVGARKRQQINELNNLDRLYWAGYEDGRRDERICRLGVLRFRLRAGSVTAGAFGIVLLEVAAVLFRVWWQSL